MWIRSIQAFKAATGLVSATLQISAAVFVALIGGLFLLLQPMAQAQRKSSLALPYLV
jgi:hypothetical protein